jgi:tetratricopeptide (TPR) repeat protein
LGELLSFLRRQRRYDNSLIIAVGDHGEGLGEHNEQTHGIFLYDSTTHVPLIAKLPAGRHAGRTISTQVRTVDLVPTILELVSTPQQRNTIAKFDGRSLATLIETGEGFDQPALGETDYPLRFGWAPLRSFRAADVKFIEAPRPELYDLHSDPAETRNIYEPWNESVKNARSTLAKLARPTNMPQPGSVPKSTVDELRALGYLGPEGATNVPELSLLPDPKDKIEIQNLLHSAMMAAEDGQTSAARNSLLKAVEADPRSAIAYSQLGQLELKSGDYGSAAAHLLKAHQLRPDDAMAAMYLGEAHEKAGNLPAARDAYQASLKTASGQASVRTALGRVYLRMNQPKAAIEQLEAAIFVQPNDADARTQFGRALVADGQLDKAAAQLEQATRIQPKNRDTLLLLQSVYERLGKRDLARRAAQRASALAR